MNKLKIIALISLFFTLTTHNVMYAAEFQDSFVQDFSEFKQNFSENGEVKSSIKEEIKTQKTKKEKKSKKEKQDSQELNIEKTTEIDIKSDYIEYFPERQEIEAVGNASITLPSNGAVLRADKLIYNQEMGLLKGYGNVRLIKDTNVMDGESITIDLNQKNALMDEAITENAFVRLKSENAQMIAGKDIMLENGLANIKEDRIVLVGNTNFSSFGTNELSETQKVFYLKENYDSKYTIKAKEIIIDARAEHDLVTVKDANIYLKDMKVNSAGTIKLITNKQQQYIETNMPEIGFLRQFGSYVGPGFSTPAPFGGALKLVPLFNVFRGEMGAGAMARYHNSKNLTEFAISSAENTKTILRGEQDLTDNLKLIYGMNGYMNEWFMGDRAPGGIAELVYHQKHVAEDIGVRFEHRFTGGFAQEFDSTKSTARFRWMAQADKPIWYYGDDINNRYAAFELSTQVATYLYGTGDTMALMRFGPRLRLETDRWIQTLGYFYAAKHGDSPFYFDKYMYGTNNVYLTEGVKLNKYLSVMWRGSIAMNRDAWDGKYMQENRFFVMVGPEDVKFTLGYDTVRERTFFSCFMLLGTKNMDLQYKKLYIKNTANLGKSQNETRKAEKAKLEAKAEIKPSFMDRLFKRQITTNIEPEREEKVLVEENMQPITNKLSEHEIIKPKIIEKKELPITRGVTPSKLNSGAVRLHDSNVTPMLTPMISPMMNMGM